MKVEVWYYSQNLKPLGPHTLEEIRMKILRGEIGPQDLVLHSTIGEWRPTLQYKEFEWSLFPALQGYDPNSGTVLTEKEWVLLIMASNGASPIQEGPFSMQDLRRDLQQKKYTGEEHIWKQGLSGWCRMKDRPELAQVVEKVLLDSI